MVVQSILDTDLYKFTTSYAYMKLFPQAVGRFSFIDRDNTQYDAEFIKLLKIELCNLAQLSLRKEEFEYMTQNCRFIPKYYFEWLQSFEFNINKIVCYLDEEKHLQIEVSDLLYKVTLYEVPILAIVSEVRNKWLGYRTSSEDIMSKLKEKINLSNWNQMPFSEFGTRRRFSNSIQDTVLSELSKRATYCTGTSNCYYAMKYGMKMMGTHPHEWFMFHGAMYGYKQANYQALENWVNVYDGDLGIALSDTYTTDVFLKNLSKKQAKLFDGVRHDSGCPFRFTNKVINRYRELGIDPTTKTIIFSNALTFPEALEIMEFCSGRIRCSFGIGTNLTNDTGNKPANIVMKLISCQMNINQPVYTCVKLSDDAGKHTGFANEVTNCMISLGIKHDEK